MIKTKRVHDKAARNDGVRVLVDRLWPRGISKDEARVDLWLKAIAPSNELRKWFNHDPERWDEFVQRYADELDEWQEVIEPVFEFLEKQHKTVTLLFAAKDQEHNNAVALQRYLQG